jgi:hypothetical protein
MDARYRDAVKSVVQKYARLKPSHGQIETCAVCDDEGGLYCLVDTGWDRGRRVHGMLIFVRVFSGTVQIEYDGMECGITDDLMDAGVPEDAIVHAWRVRPEVADSDVVLHTASTN